MTADPNGVRPGETLRGGADGQGVHGAPAAGEKHRDRAREIAKELYTTFEPRENDRLNADIVFAALARVEAETRREVEDERAALRAECETLRVELKRRDERTFPVLYGHAGAANGPRSVPWAWVKNHAGQCERNHYQTVERLAERGGLDPTELWMVVHGKEWKGTIAPVTNAQALAWLRSQPWIAGTEVAATDAPDGSVRAGEEG